ncbi:MAG: AAA family ATPase [Bacteroidales bacterium]|nr:AAA family ATPase [Bacteroidales bacterium]
MDAFNLCNARRVFRPTPDTHCYFPAVGAEQTITHLLAAQADQAGLAIVDGEPGLGKTLSALRFLERLPATANRVFLPLGRYATPHEFYQAILFDLGEDYHGLSEQESRLLVADHFLRQLSAGNSTILIMDEAHHLSTELLEEIRLLDNLESHSSKAVFTVLLSLPSLRRRLAQPGLAAFSQRIAVRCRLEPLSEEETAHYLHHHLELVGADRYAVMSEEARTILGTSCRGVPRLINQAMTLALTLTEQAGESIVDVEAVLEALLCLGLSTDPVTPDPEPDLSAGPRRPATGAGGKRKTTKRRSA